MRERATLLSDIYAYCFDVQPVSLGDASDAERIFGMPVSGTYFHALGVTPALGRFFTDGDDRLDGPPVTVISYDLWQRRFGGAADTIGRVVRFNSKPVAVIGIAPPGFQGTTLLRPDAWMPIEQIFVCPPPRALWLEASSGQERESNPQTPD